MAKNRPRQKKIADNSIGVEDANLHVELAFRLPNVFGYSLNGADGSKVGYAIFNEIEQSIGLYTGNIWKKIAIEKDEIKSTTIKIGIQLGTGYFEILATVDDPLIFQVNGVTHTKTSAITYPTFTYPTFGYKRVDLLCGNVNGGLTLVTGVEALSNPAAPSLPANLALLAKITIENSGSLVGIKYIEAGNAVDVSKLRGNILDNKVIKEALDATYLPQSTTAFIRNNNTGTPQVGDININGIIEAAGVSAGAFGTPSLDLSLTDAEIKLGGSATIIKFNDNNSWLNWKTSDNLTNKRENKIAGNLFVQYTLNVSDLVAAAITLVSDTPFDNWTFSGGIYGDSCYGISYANDLKLKLNQSGQLMLKYAPTAATSNYDLVVRDKTTGYLKKLNGNDILRGKTYGITATAGTITDANLVGAVIQSITKNLTPQAIVFNAGTGEITLSVVNTDVVAITYTKD